MTGEESDRVVIEHSELEAAMAAIRLAFDGRRVDVGRARAKTRARRGWSSGSKRSSTCRAISGRRPPCGPAGSRSSNWPTKRLKSPRHESRWFNLAGFFLRPGRGFPLDELRLKALWPDLPSGGQAHQGRAVLGRVVDPLAQGGRGPVAPAPRRDSSPTGPVSSSRQGDEPVQEGRAPQARAARARRDVAMRGRTRAIDAVDQRIVG